jgi:hypothetical protein
LRGSLSESKDYPYRHLESGHALGHERAQLLFARLSCRDFRPELPE